MKKLILITGIFMIGTILTAKVPEEIKKAYELKKSEGTIVAMFKYTLKSSEKESDKVTAVMIRGFDVAYEEAKESDTLGAGVMFDDKTIEANYIKYEDLKAFKEGKMSPDEFSTKIIIKHFKNEK